MKNVLPIRRARLARSIAPALLSALLFALPSALLLASGCSAKEEPPQTQVDVQAAAVRVAAVTQHVTADAVLSALAQAAIMPKITAPIQKVYVRRGARVRAGQMLAVLDNTDLKAALTDSQGVLDAAKAAYDTAVHAQIPEDYRRAELDLRQAKANLDLNRSIVASRKKLFAEGAIAGRDLDTSEAALVQAQAAYDTAEQHLAAMKEVSRAAALQAATGQLESARGKYQGAEAALDFSEIRSPIAGVVTESPFFAGETAAPGTPLVTVMDVSALIAKIHLSQPQTQTLEQGDPASVDVPGMLHPVPGKITVISPALDPGSTTVEVWVRLENPKRELRAGTAVHVTLAGHSAPHALVVPSASIVLASSGKPTVMVVGSDGIAHQTPVETGISGEGLTQILSGLSAGQQVVTVGAYALDDGTRVKVVPSLAEHGSPAGGEGLPATAAPEENK